MRRADDLSESCIGIRSGFAIARARQLLVRPHAMRYVSVDATIIHNAGADLAIVDRWLLELDDRGTTVREIGLGTDGSPVRLAPDGRDRGVWCDSPVLILGPEWNELSQSEFERVWVQALNSPSGQKRA